MNALKKIQYNCKEATFLIEKKQLTKLTIKERVKLRIHLYGCSVCRVFEQQSRMINRMIRELFYTTDAKLDDDFKRELQEQINEKMKE